MLTRRELDAYVLCDNLSLLGYFFTRGGIVIVSLLVRGGVVKQLLQRGPLVVIGMAVGVLLGMPAILRLLVLLLVLLAQSVTSSLVVLRCCHGVRLSSHILCYYVFLYLLIMRKLSYVISVFNNPLWLVIMINNSLKFYYAKN